MSYRQAPVFRMGAFSDTLEVAAPWSRLAALYEGVRRALSRHVFVMAHLSHAYPDGCSIYFTFAGARPTEAASLEAYDAAWRDALAAVVEAGGTISHHHGTGRSKAPKIPAELGAGILAVRAIQQAFDPSGICNPGNLIPPGPPPRMDISVSSAPVLDEVSRTVSAPATLPLRDLERFLEAAGHSLDVDPAVLASDRTVGVWLADGAPGSRDPWEDPVDHLVAGFVATLPTGERFRLGSCPRRAAGPDLAALYLGTNGVCGALLSADLRVAKIDETKSRPMPYRGPRGVPETAGETALWQRLVQALR